MTWNSTWPVGTVSVRANRTTGQQNTTYIETTMGSTANDIAYATTQKDHFWNVGSNFDGHHRFIKMPAFTVGGVPTDPGSIGLGTSMGGIMYMRTLTSTQSTAQQDVNLFFRNSTTQVMQMLGIRAMGVFNGGAATPVQADVVYSHNLALQSAGTPGIVRTATGLYTITFATALPSANYLVLGGSIRNSSTASDDSMFYMQANTSLTNVKSTTRLKVGFKNPDGSEHDPLQGWFICFGG